MTADLLDDCRDLVARWDDVRADLEAESEPGEYDYNAGMAEGARSAAMELQRVIDRHATRHLVCSTCAAEAEPDRPHEVLTASESAAEAFRLGHHGHRVREAVVA